MIIQSHREMEKPDQNNTFLIYQNRMILAGALMTASRIPKAPLEQVFYRIYTKISTCDDPEKNKLHFSF